MPRMCKHGRQRYFCKQCGGSQICEHGRRHSRCKECSNRAPGKKPRRSEAPAAAPKRATKRKRSFDAWPCGAPPGVPVVAASAAGAEDATGEGQGARKPTRYEAMWTDCDPSLWEYVVV